jgi:glycosyltransferase involved in cell wall biosynthesis
VKTFEVSVIIPVHNGGKYLGEAIESVLQQTYVPSEVIVVDDGSEDNTARIAESFGNKLLYTYQSNQGAASARNRGIEVSSKPYIAFLDSDDLWVNTKLEHQKKTFLQNHDCDLSFGYIEEFFETMYGDEKKFQTFRKLPGYSPLTAIIKRKVFSTVGTFNTSFPTGEFIEWYARVKDHGFKDYILPEVLALRRIHKNNMTLNKGNLQIGYTHMLKNILDRRRKLTKSQDE